jgi:uncharacterized protein (TIGR00251 family)
MFELYKEKMLNDGQVYFLCKVFPGAPKTEIKEFSSDNIEGRDVGIFKIAISASAEKGRANKELIKFLSKKAEVFPDDVLIVSGKTDRIKLIKIKNKDN